MTTPVVLVVADFLVARQNEWNPGLGAVLYRPNDGVSPALAAEVEVVVSAGDLSNTLVDALPKLKLVACFSTGYAGIDTAHLHKRGIRLTTAAGINAHDVADHALALLLSLWHRVAAGDQAVRNGSWRTPVLQRPSLRGRRAGVVGLGRIGTAIAMRLASHELDVRWWGPHDKEGCQFLRASSLHALAQWSDILVIASRASGENRHQIDSAVLAALGPQGVIVNVSRGMLIDEAALVAALREGRLGGAALDVFDQEPASPAQWAELPNLLLTPHIAGYTQEAGKDMFGQLRENLRRYFAGEPLLSPLEIQ